MDAIYCPACGAANPLEAAVCESCGEDLAAVKSVIDTANTHYNEALALAHSGKLDEAIGQLEAALALSAQNAHYHNLLGTIYARKGLFSEAIRAWERCVALDPEAEKAYQNIEKARRMEEDVVEEQRKRPFLLTSIAACVIAAFLLFSTVYFASRAYFKGKLVNDLSTQLTNANLELTKWKSNALTLETRFPAGGIDALSNKIVELQTLAEARKQQNEQTNASWTANMQKKNEEIASLQNQIKELTSSNQDLTTKNQSINQLQGVINSKNTDIKRLQTMLTQRDEELKTANSLAESHRISLVTSQATINALKQERERAIATLRDENDKTVAGLRSSILEQRDEIAKLERRAADMQYADGLAVEALKNYENNNFSLALTNTENALTRVGDHAACFYLRDKIQLVLNDPLEQEIRRKELAERELKRQKEKETLVKDNLQTARNYLKQGSYDKAIQMSERTLALLPQEDKNKEELNRIKQQSEEKKREILAMLLEAKTNIANDDKKQAELTLKIILKQSPDCQEAKDLLQQISQ
ncbi:MAG: tetratricopeptide repeat protein [Candidatus Omnitrophota bacterium]